MEKYTRTSMHKNTKEVFDLFYLPMVTEGFSHPVVLLLLRVRNLLPVFHQQLLVHLQDRLQLGI